jgi:hypothetical protein
MVGWLAYSVWQLWLAQTEGKIMSRNGYVTRASNETTFESCMIFYWLAIVWGSGMVIAMIVFTIQ